MSSRRSLRGRAMWRCAGFVAGLLCVGVSAHAQGRDPWSRGSEWISVRAGYAKSAAAGAGNGSVGAGFGYARFRNSQWSYGAQAAVDVVSTFGDAKEIESPWTFEFLRHYRWRTPARPYLGAGAGAYFNKISGTTRDEATLVPGYYLAGGLNTQVSAHGLLGFDVRLSLVDLDKQDNPVFGGEATLGKRQKRAPHWSVKATYARTH